MSLILEALNRSAQERQEGDQAPGLGTPAFSDTGQRTNRWLSWLPWVAFGVALLVIFYLLFTTGGNEHSGAAAPVVQQLTPLVADPLGPESPVDGAGKLQSAPRTTALASDTAADAGVLENVATAAQRREGATLPTQTTVLGEAVREQGDQPATNSNTQQAAPTDPEIAALYRSQSPTEAARVQPKMEPTAPPKAVPATESPATTREVDDQPIDIENLLTEAEDALKDARLSEHPAPFIGKLSQQLKNEIPSVMYSRHDYSNVPGQSSVVLNGQSLKVGASVKGGLKLTEILPDSIVLDYRGTEFRLRALNSWVNL